MLLVARLIGSRVGVHLRGTVPRMHSADLSCCFLGTQNALSGCLGRDPCRIRRWDGHIQKEERCTRDRVSRRRVRLRDHALPPWSGINRTSLEPRFRRSRRSPTTRLALTMLMVAPSSAYLYPGTRSLVFGPISNCSNPARASLRRELEAFRGVVPYDANTR
jgi:hypothetical protein